MRNIIFCIDSYYQLLIAINLKINKYDQDRVDVVLFNTMKNSHKIHKNLKETRLFNNVYLADTQLNKTELNSSILERVPKYFVYIFSMMAPSFFTNRVLRIKHFISYDELFFYGYRPLIQSIYNACLKVNRNVKCFRMDDGMGTYIREWNVPKQRLRVLFEKTMNYIFGFEALENNISGFYVPKPEYIRYNTPYPILRLPDYSRPDLVKMINTIFDYEETDDFNSVEYLFFGMYGDNWVKKDIEYLKILKNFIPKEKIAIKVHPREDIDPYRQLGIKIICQSTVPWEVFMINGMCKDTTFISQMSSAVITSKLLFNRNGKDIYLNNIDKKFSEVNEFLKYFIEVNNNDNLVVLPDSIEEFTKLLIK